MLHNSSVQSSRVLRTLIERTGFTEEFLTTINTPFGAQLDGMDDFIQKLHAHKDDVITISPDFDMDGITSGTILYAGLSQLGFTVNINIPDYTYGHEFSTQDVDDIVHHFPETSVILTCDSGVNSIEGIEHAHSLGLTVFVTDHHEQEVDCPADAMINPCRFNSTYPLTGICGAAVALLTVTAYARLFSTSDQSRYLNLLQLFAGIGTISDVMPLIHDNRYLVRKSLQLTHELLGNPYALVSLRNDPTVHPAFLTAFEGYAQVLSELGTTADRCDESFYGYILSPMFNAPRRVGSDMRDAFDVFLNRDASSRRLVIQALMAANAQRKDDVKYYMAHLDDTYAPYVYITDAPKGMLGLLAGQLMHASSLPTAVVRKVDNSADADSADADSADEIVLIEGSMRAPSYYPIMDHMESVDDVHVQGHQSACGVSGSLQSLVKTLRTVHAPDEVLHPQPAVRIGESNCDVQWYDIPTLTQITDFLESLRPFGHGFEYPVIELDVPRDATVTRLGSEKQHLKIQAPGCPPALLWNTEEAPESFTVELSYNNFRGRRTVQLIGRQ